MAENQPEEKKELSLEEKKEKMGKELLDCFISSQFSDVGYNFLNEPGLKDLALEVLKCNVAKAKEKALEVIKYFNESYLPDHPLDEVSHYTPMEYIISHSFDYTWFPEGKNSYANLSKLFLEVRKEYLDKGGKYSNQEMKEFCQTIHDRLLGCGDTENSTNIYYQICDKLGLSRERVQRDRIVSELRIKVDKVTSGYRFKTDAKEETKARIKQINEAMRKMEIDKNTFTFLEIIAEAKRIDSVMHELVEKEDSAGYSLGTKDNMEWLSFDLEQDLYRDDLLDIAK